MSVSSGVNAGKVPNLGTVDYATVIDDLRTSGADRVDSVRFHYIEALVRRSNQYQGETRNCLDNKIAKALAEFNERVRREKIAATTTTVLNTQESPDIPPSPLVELTNYLEQHSQEKNGDIIGRIPRAPPELKSLRYFRNTWSELSVDRQISEAMRLAPENAGPLNSHYLVLRSLKLMQEISPDYLRRFMSYVDALLCIEQAAMTGKPQGKIRK